jgi:uncharacterized 2Fe-2S/4Fe-4S cluster protein (DUF4445 family)
MAKVTFYPFNKSIDVQEGITVLEAARLAQITIEAPCAGMGTCGKCKVKLNTESLVNVQQEESDLPSLDEAGFVLACHTKIKGDVHVEIIAREQNDSLLVLGFGKGLDFEPDSFIKKVYAKDKSETYIYAGDKNIGVEEGDTTRKLFGVVVDIGTTTLVVSLVDLLTGRELTTASGLNPQSLYAQDVLSRIKFASEDNGLEIMYSVFIKEIKRLLAEVLSVTGVERTFIYEIVFSGNTCMLHLATGVNPDSLGRYPYTPQIIGGNYVSAKENGLDISKFGIIYLPPIISAFVGADITSGILASGLESLDGVTFFIDIGTNGEMVIAIDGKLSASSTAAGPAFEGMNISCGMRAGEGAIEYFDIDKDGAIIIKIIGENEAVGICGSGLLDIVGELVSHGIIGKNGRFANPEKDEINLALLDKLVRQDGKTIFKLTDTVYLSQKDVRQVQLAKGAIRTGIEFLLKNKNLTAEKVDRVQIAGSFGYHLREDSLINIGLLPKEFSGKIEFVGNTSKTGGQAFLLRKDYKDKMQHLVSDIEVIELANCPDFEKEFISFLNF